MTTKVLKNTKPPKNVRRNSEELPTPKKETKSSEPTPKKKKTFC